MQTKMMRINAPEGQKVVCRELRTGLLGGYDAVAKIQVDRIYTVKATKVFKDSSRVILAEIPEEEFNTVLFEECGEVLPATKTSKELYYEGLAERQSWRGSR